MSSYRIEVSPNNRAGCQDTVCKAQNIKLHKGEIRFGTWVTMAGTEHGSWRYKHWGCVSGLQIQGLRETTQGDGDEYNWELIDGYDELNDHPDVQEKIRRVITQGHIDPEDFNGDPEFNVLGKRGIRGRAKKAKADEEDGAEEPATSPVKAKAPASKKRAKVADDEDEDEKPKKKRAKASKKAKDVSDAEDEPEEKPKKKAQAKKAKKAKLDSDESEPEVMPQKKSRGGKVVKSEADDEAEEQKPKAKGRASKKPKVESEEGEAEVMPQKNQRGKKIKAEFNEDEPKEKPKAKKPVTKRVQASQVKPEVDDDATASEAEKAPESELGTIVSAKKGRAGKKSLEPAFEPTGAEEASPEPEPESARKAKPVGRKAKGTGAVNDDGKAAPKGKKRGRASR